MTTAHRQETAGTSLTGRRAAAGGVIAVWAGSRAFFFVVGAVGHASIPSADVGGAYSASVGSLGYWAHWDGRWFLHIARHGYDSVAAGRVMGITDASVRRLLQEARTQVQRNLEDRHGA